MEITVKTIENDEVQVFIYNSNTDTHAIMEFENVEDKSFENLLKLMNTGFPTLIKKIRE